MNTARFAMADSTRDNVAAVMVYADTKSDAKEAIQVAKAWIRASGRPCKVVFFYERWGSEWSSLGRSYVARIAYRVN